MGYKSRSNHSGYWVETFCYQDMPSRLRHLFLIRVLWIAFICSFPAANALSLDEALPPMQESQAYQSFLRRSPSELSKLLYLIDRFKDSTIKVRFNGTEYDASLAATTARLYLSRFYRNEKAYEWVTRRCTQSPLGDDPIFFRYPDGRSRLARKVLLEELQQLDGLAQSCPRN